MKDIKNLRAVIAVAALAAATAGFAFAGAASATGVSKSDAGTSSKNSSSDQGQVTVQRERGVVLEGSGSADGLDVMVLVYDNDRHGSSIQVVLGDPDDGGQIGWAEQKEPYVVDGRLAASVEIEGQVLTVSGSVTETGKPKQVHEQHQDAGEQIIVKGTHVQLLTDVSASFGDAVVGLQFAPAFAFDLEVRKVRLYGR